MRVGFSLVAGAIASMVMSFGFFTAHMERVTTEVAHWTIADTDHQAFVAVGNRSLGPGDSCEDQSINPCADSDDIAAVIRAFEQEGREWWFFASILHTEFSVPQPVDPQPDTQVSLNMPKAITVYASSEGEIPVVEGRAPSAANEIALHADLAQRLGVEIGGTVLLSDRDEDSVAAPVEFTVTGLTVTPKTYVPFSAVPTEYPEWFLTAPLAVITPEAVPSLAGDRGIAGAAWFEWDGSPSTVTSLLPEATVEDGFDLSRAPLYRAYWWLSLAGALAVASMAWWAFAARRRGPRSWRDGAVLIAAPPVAAMAVLTIAATMHAEWVRAIAPYTYLPQPLPLPMPWTITALAAGAAIAAVGAGWRERRLQHHEVVDVNELAGEVIAQRLP